MACPKCQTMWHLIDGVLKCPNPTCGVISPYQPVPSQANLLENYQILLGKCQDLVSGEMSLNNFRIFLTNLE